MGSYIQIHLKGCTETLCQSSVLKRTSHTSSKIKQYTTAIQDNEYTKCLVSYWFDSLDGDKPMPRRSIAALFAYNYNLTNTTMDIVPGTQRFPYPSTTTNRPLCLDRYRDLTLDIYPETRMSYNYCAYRHREKWTGDFSTKTNRPNSKKNILLHSRNHLERNSFQPLTIDNHMTPVYSDVLMSYEVALLKKQTEIETVGVDVPSGDDHDDIAVSDFK